LALKINGNRGAQQEICFNKVSKETTISTGFSNLRVWCKKRSNWTSGIGQKIRLHPKTSDSATLDGMLLCA